MSAQVFTSDSNIQEELDQNEKIEELLTKIKELEGEISDISDNDIGTTATIPSGIGSSFTWDSSKAFVTQNSINNGIASAVFYIAFALRKIAAAEGRLTAAEGKITALEGHTHDRNPGNSQNTDMTGPPVLPDSTS